MEDRKRTALKEALRTEIKHELALKAHAERKPATPEDSPELEAFVTNADEGLREVERWEREQAQLEARAISARKAILRQGSEVARQILNQAGACVERISQEALPNAVAQVVSKFNTAFGANVTALPNVVLTTIPLIQKLVAAERDMAVAVWDTWTFDGNGRQILKQDYRLEVVRRRSEFELDKARQRAHILEGLQKALKNLDEVVAIIRKSPDADTARNRLMRGLKISEVQAQAILDMPLKRLAALERRKIDEEYRELLAQIKQLEALLRSPKKLRQQVNDELQDVKDAFADKRRTHIVQLREGETKVSLLTKSDLVEEKEIWISVNSAGLISRSSSDKPPRLSGREAPKMLLKSSSRNILYLVNEMGEAAAVPVHSIPESDEPNQGGPLHRLTPFPEGTNLVRVFSLPSRSQRDDTEARLSNHFVLTITRAGMLKKSPLADLPGASAGLFTLTKVNPGDQLGWLTITNNQNEIMLASSAGMAIRFHEESIRPMGLVAAGVMGMKLQAGDEICGVDLLPKPGDAFFISSHGRGKRVPVAQFPRQGRYGQGVVAWKLPLGERVSGMTLGKGTSQAAVSFNKLASKSIRLDAAPLQSRTARGSLIFELKTDQRVIGLMLPWEEEGITVRGKTTTTFKSSGSKSSSGAGNKPPQSPTVRSKQPSKVSKSGTAGINRGGAGKEKRSGISKSAVKPARKSSVKPADRKKE